MYVLSQIMSLKINNCCFHLLITSIYINIVRSQPYCTTTNLAQNVDLLRVSFTSFSQDVQSVVCTLPLHLQCMCFRSAGVSQWHTALGVQHVVVSSTEVEPGSTLAQSSVTTLRLVQQKRIRSQLRSQLHGGETCF